MLESKYVFEKLKAERVPFSELREGPEWFVIETAFHEFHLSKDRFIFKQYAIEEHECSNEEFLRNGIPGLDDTFYAMYFKNCWEPLLSEFVREISA